MRNYTLEQMSELMREGFAQAEVEIFRSLRGVSTEERIALLHTLDALQVVQKQLVILLEFEETENA